MERIGIAASKISKGNLWAYNGAVIMISFLISVLLFFLSGCAIVVALGVIKWTVGPFVPTITVEVWNMIYVYSLIVLAVLVGVINCFALFKNIRLKK